MVWHIGQFVRTAMSRKKNGAPAEFPKLESMMTARRNKPAEPMSPDLQWQIMAKLSPPK